MNRGMSVVWMPEMIRTKTKTWLRFRLWQAGVLSVGLHVGVGAWLGLLAPAQPKLITLITVDFMEQGACASTPLSSRGRNHRQATRPVLQETLVAQPNALTESSAVQNLPLQSAAGTETGGGETMQESTGTGVSGNSSMHARFLADHFEDIRSRIQRCLAYPALARKLGWSGETTVSFVITLEGRVAELGILRSSEHILLDEAVLKAVRAAEPFPRPPLPTRLILPVAYRLEQAGRE
jgi:TonB family protein